LESDDGTTTNCTLIVGPFEELTSEMSLSSTSSELPERANVVVVGGGIIGTSVAYHLAKYGVEDVLLLERDRLTSGTTWHAAGLMNTFGSMVSTTE